MPNSPSALGQARLAKEQALARLRQLQTGRLEGQLLDRDMVRHVWSQALAAFRDRALGMADRVVSRGAGRTAAELHAIIDSEVREMGHVLHEDAVATAC